MNNFATDLEKFGNAVALIHPEGRRLSYLELAQYCNRFANFFSTKKQLILIETSNDIDCIIAYLAALRHKNPVMLIDADLDSQLKEKIYHNYRPDLIWKKNSSKYQLFHQQHTDKLHPQLAILLSTSGSTGSPKCVRLSTENLHSNALAITQYLNLTPDERAITLLPLHYSYGLSILNSHLAAGASIVIQQQGILDKNFWQAMRSEKVTSLSGVPFIYETLEKLRFADMQLPDLRCLTQAGGHLAPALVEKFARLCDQRSWQFFVMYGQTEASPRISYLTTHEALRKPTSIGNAIPGGKLTICNESGQEISQPEQPGELIYRGKNVMLGYAEKREDLSRGDELHGVLNTGDIAKFDNDGDFYIVGRKKRFIKIFGQRFNLDEIENQLQRQGLTAACCGQDDLLQIFVEGNHDPQNIRKMLADYYRIYNKAILVKKLPTLPKTNSGKIDYLALSCGDVNA